MLFVVQGVPDFVYNFLKQATAEAGAGSPTKGKEQTIID